MKPEEKRTDAPLPLTLHTEAQKEFLAHNRDPGENADPERLRMSGAGEGDLSGSGFVALRWDPSEGRGILLSRDPGFSDAVWIPGEDGSARVGNLRVGERYWWKPEAGEARSFATSDAPPRFLSAGGVCNIRDAGGWITEEGLRIRQGRIFRGCEFNGHCTVTPEGIRTLKYSLGVRTDLDLRGEAAGVIDHSPLGRDVNWILIPANAYGHLWDPAPSGREAVRRIFEIFADEGNYPVYYHCWGGADRTGSVAYLLGASLGMREEDLLLDYELTSLARIFGPRDRFSPEFGEFEIALGTEKGSTPREKAESFLRDCGVTDDSLARLRRNLLENR